MKIYIASSWRNAPEVVRLAQHLEQKGFEVDAFCRKNGKREVFDYKDGEGPFADIRDRREINAITFLQSSRVKDAFFEDKKWIDWADAVVMYMPCGKSSHLEGGYAKGHGKRLYMYGSFPDGEFEVMYGFADGIYPLERLDALINELRHDMPSYHFPNTAPITDEEFEKAIKLNPSRYQDERDELGRLVSVFDLDDSSLWCRMEKGWVRSL